MKCGVLPSVLVLAILSPSGAGQTLVKDIDETYGVESSDPQDFLVVGNEVYFVATTPDLGDELWRSDGTPAGTVSVVDLEPGYSSSSPDLGAVLPSGEVVFGATRAADVGCEIWKTDGTAAGTQLVADIVPGTAGSSPHEFVSFGGEVYFLATGDGWSAPGLWKTDGTAAGTVSLSCCSSALWLARAGSKLFVASGPHGSDYHLHVTDGTPSGYIDLGPLSISEPTALIALGDRLLFVAETVAEGGEPWSSDGTPGGTGILSDINPGANHSVGDWSQFVVVGNRAYFSAYLGPGDSELWMTQGTPATTAHLDLPSLSTPYPLANLNGELIFKATVSMPFDDLYRTDGTPGGTFLVAERVFHRYNTRSTAVMGGEMYFVGDEDLMKTDGTPAGTVVVHPAEPLRFASAGSYVLMTSWDAHGWEPWATDGTPAGTVLLGDLDPHLTGDSEPNLLAVFGDRLIFIADDDVHGREMWVSDGTPAGTEMLHDLFASSWPSYPLFVDSTEDFILFSGFEDLNGYEPWVSDGTPAGTSMLVDIRPGGDWSMSSGGGSSCGSDILFVANDGAHGEEIWVTDGTAAGTSMLVDIETNGGLGSSPNRFTDWNGLVYFRATTTAKGRELYVSDGTAAGTSLVLDIWPGPDGSTPGARPGAYAGLGDYLYFVADDGVHGAELWRTDGSAGGTTLVADVWSGPYGSNPLSLHVLDGQLLFVDNGTLNPRLWVSDGTAAGTQEVVRLPGVPAEGLRVLDDEAVFVMESTVEPGELELWVTDGTSAGTGPLSTPTILGTNELGVGRPGSSRGLFCADDGVLGQELWITDGTDAGTGVLFDLAPGDAFPHDFLRLGNRIFFAADDGVAGVELHAIDLADADDWGAATYGFGCPGSNGVVPRISLDGVPRASSTQSFSIEVDGAAPNAAAMLLLSWTPGNFGLGGGCRLWVTPPLWVGLTGTDPSGHASISFPPSPGLIGLAAHFQYAVFDAGAAYKNQLSSSEALEVVGGP